MRVAVQADENIRIAFDSGEHAARTKDEATALTADLLLEFDSGEHVTLPRDECIALAAELLVILHVWGVLQDDPGERLLGTYGTLGPMGCP